MIRAILSVAVCLMAAPSISIAQGDNRAAAKELCETKLSKDLLKQISRSSAKDAKNLVKDGWQTFPGAHSIEKQLYQCYLMQFSLNEDNSPSFIIAEGTGSGLNYDSAKSQAIKNAKENLSTLMPHDSTTFTNDSTSHGTDNFITVVELYRPTPQHGKEVLLRIASMPQ